MTKELSIPLPNGGTLRCGEGRWPTDCGGAHEWGGYMRICDADGIEVVYWDSEEWKNEPESVIGAAFVSALDSIENLKSLLNRTHIVEDHWE